MHGCRLLFLIVVTGLASGCQLGRTMFQMDSNSRTPFFGVDLLGQNSSKTEARASSVADLRDGPSEATIKPVVDSQPAARKKGGLLEKLSLKRAPERIPLQLTEAETVPSMGPEEEFR